MCDGVCRPNELFFQNAPLSKYYICADKYEDEVTGMSGGQISTRALRRGWKQGVRWLGDGFYELGEAREK